MEINELSAKDLMEGDWAYGIYFGCPRERIAIKYSICSNSYEWKYMPIPVIPEILEKNGFVANKHVYPYPYYEYINEEDGVKVGFAFPQGNRTSYKEPWVYIDSENAFIEHLPCVFVHQLQQILRLCGIEKAIKL